ncbi:hypothetical protein FE257_004243 [Aspergillus nanangensis]|uniref:Uncharacterized protein n=1 Tax=Aspergillus nanangensis TaxID=2582783 RepID=A0AAD4GW09_ASPNN|nr:hypothetical protein FE257_004243 [Aspergillus nanangensis]
MTIDGASVSGLPIPTSAVLSDADAFVMNHHVRSHQHAMILCAVPASRSGGSHMEQSVRDLTSEYYVLSDQGCISEAFRKDGTCCPDRNNHLYATGMAAIVGLKVSSDNIVCQFN